jgi:hypothetical protein
LAKGCVARSNQILADKQVRRLVEHAFRLDRDGDFAILVTVLAATGARFSQVARMRVEDVQPAQRRLLVPTLRKGQKRVAGDVKVCVGAELIEALAPIMEGRGYDEVLLQRWRYRQTDRISWVRDRRGPWTSASEMTRAWKQLTASAGLPHCIPYALRHSSIVRGLRAGLPVRLVAALHDTSFEIERHYSRWITDGLEELAARAVIPLIISEDQRSRMLVACLTRPSKRCHGVRRRATGSDNMTDRLDGLGSHRAADAAALAMPVVGLQCSRFDLSLPGAATRRRGVRISLLHSSAAIVRSKGEGRDPHRLSETYTKAVRRMLRQVGFASWKRAQFARRRRPRDSRILQQAPVPLARRCPGLVRFMLEAPRSPASH